MTGPSASDHLGGKTPPGRAILSSTPAAIPPSPRPRRLLLALAEALAPEQPALPAEGRAVVLADVAGFLAFEVRALPGWLRGPYRLALLGFEALALLRYGRPFSALDLPRRRAWLALWADGPIGLTRDFVKLLRSCALLEYFDHPLVREALDAAAMPHAVGGAS